MRLINRKDIEDWAKSFDSKGHLPILISKLVRATTPKSTFAEFPSGSSVFVEGWDGIVKCTEQTAYVGEGVSLWEFGTEKNNKKKADSDYSKRTSDPLAQNPSECIFVFATPNFWRDKEKWRLEKLKDKVWKDIRVYDSRNLEEWLDIAPYVSRWFSVFVNKYPSD
jgi:hypothetical protein